MRATKSNQNGNVFTALFGAVVLVGIVGYAATNLMKGPLNTAVKVTRQNTAESQMAIAAQVAVLAANVGGAGDCDSDGFVEPLEWRVPPVTSPVTPVPINGGLIPDKVVVNKVDPWGNEYGYCVWDHGPTKLAAGCQKTTPGTNLRLEGINSTSFPVVAIISSGPDRKFTTTCRPFSTGSSRADTNNDGDLDDAGDFPLVSKAANADDDIIFTYTYQEASGASGGLWSLKSGSSGTATIGKKIEAQDATLSGTALFTALGGTNTSGSTELSGALGHWALDETSGTTIVDSIAGRNGVSDTAVTSAAGKVGTALTFGSGEDEILINDNIFDNLATMTVCAWIKSPNNTSSTAQEIVDKSDDGYSQTWQFYTEAGGKFSYYNRFRGGASSPSGVLQNNTWQHVCVTWDGGDTGTSTKLYVDGLPVATSPWTGNASQDDDSSHILTIGASSYGNWDFVGQIDDVRIYNRVLSDAEITQVKNDTGSGGVSSDYLYVDKGLLLPLPSAMPTCDASTKGVLRRDAAGTGLDFCDGTSWNSLSGGTPADCTGLGDGYVNDASSGHCFYKVNTSVTRPAAESACEVNGAHLAVPSNATADSIIDGFGGNRWIGLDDINSDGTWIYSYGPKAGVQFWTGNGSGSVVGGQFAGWHSGEPDGSTSENCAISNYFGDYGWVDYPCTNTTEYVCEKDPGGTTTSFGMPSGAVSWWKFDETSGTSTADAIGTNTGTRSGGATFTTDGKNNGGMAFSGATGAVTIPNNSSLDSSTGTWFFFYKSDGSWSTDSPVLMGRADASGSRSGMNLSAQKSGQLFLQIYNASTSVCEITTGAFLDNLWHAVAVTYDQASGGSEKLYVDGVFMGSCVNSAAWTFNGQSLTIGRALDTYWQMFKGKIDEVVVFNRVLTKSEITSLGMFIASNGGTDSNVVTNGLIGYWKFNETSGTTFSDSSANSNVLTGASGASPAPSTDGKIAGSVLFTSDNATAAADTAQNATSFSISAWIKPASVSGSSGYQMFLDKGLSASERHNYYFQLEDNNLDCGYTNSSGTYSYVTGSGTINSTDWQHVVCTFDLATHKFALYLNGTLDATATVVNTPTTQGTIVVGKDAYSGSGYLTGNLDELRLYNRALTASEVTQLYKYAGNAVTSTPDTSTGMVGWWKFDDGTGTTAADSSGYNINGTLSGGVTWTTGKNGGAIHVDGASGSKVSLGTTSLLNISNAITISAWIKPSSWGGSSTGTIFARQGTYGLNYQIDGRIGRNGQIIYNDNNGDAFQGSAGIDFGQWYMMTVTVDSGTVKFYINGDYRNTVTGWPLVGQGNSYDAWIGADKVGGGNFDGDIDDVVIYTRALTDTDIKGLYKTGPTAPPSCNLANTDGPMYIVSGSTWTVPADWNNSNNTIEVIGGGGGGGSGAAGGCGGGGGAYSKATNVTLTPGATVTVNVGANGGQSQGNPGTDGGDTYLCNSTSNCASIAGTAVVVGAKGGAGGGNAGTCTAGAGGASASGVGSTKYSGGNGGGDGGGGNGGAGGGGAAGPKGAGMAGGVDGGGSTGGGGGGAGGGTAGGTAPSGYDGPAGGTNYLGTGAGAGGLNSGSGDAKNGINGGGGGGSAATGSGGKGGNGVEWDSTHGAGGGGGGGAGNASTSVGQDGGDGGKYGGGGGGGGRQYAPSWAGGTGGQGLIVISYGSTNTPPTGTSGLANYWKFDATSGTTAADSTGSSPGTLTNGPVWSTGGYKNGGLKFDGIDDYVIMSGSLPIQYAHNVTYSVWFKPDATQPSSNDHSIWLSGDGTCTETLFYDPAQQNLFFEGACGGGTKNQKETISNVIIPGSWNHIAVTTDWTGSSKKSVHIYVNGTLVDDDTTFWGPGLYQSLTATSFVVGNYSAGIIDELQLYNRVLSPAEIGALYGTDNSLGGNSCGSSGPMIDDLSDAITNYTKGNMFAGDGSGNESATGANNTGFGYSALKSITTGTDNSAFGYKVMESLTTGSYNTGVGSSVLRTLVSGSYNSAAGSHALENAGADAMHNTAAGAYALSQGASNYNTAAGYKALYANNGGQYNTAVGYQSLLANTTGNYNSAVGVNSMMNNTTGSYNTGVGYQALLNNVTGSYNSAMGANALSAAITETAANCTGLGAVSYNDAVSGHCYYRIDSIMHWQQAQYACHANGAYLATITSSAENSMIYNNLGPFSYRWIGGTDKWAEGQFSWDGGGDEDGMPFYQMYSYTAPSSGLVAYWKLDELDGNGVSPDQTGNGNTLTAYPSYEPHPSPGMGRIDGAWFWPNSYATAATAPDSNSLDLTSFTVSAWVKTITNDQNEYILEKGNDGGVDDFNYFFAIVNDGTLGCGFWGNNGAFNQMQSSKKIIWGAWQHVDCTFDSATKALKIYINGILSDTITTASTPKVNATPLWVGFSGNWGSGQFEGYMDELRLYNRALSAAEITTLMYAVPAVAGSPFTSWASGEPNNYASGEDCVTMEYSPNWNDANCDNNDYGAICEKDPIKLNNTTAYGASAAAGNLAPMVTAIGYQALNGANTAPYTVALGAQSLYSNTSGFGNTAAGYQSLYTNTTGSRNSAAGYQSLYTNNADDNTGVGYQSLYANTSGTRNTAVGYQAMKGAATASGSDNTAVGYQAMTALQTGSYNSALGYSSLKALTTGSNNTAAGSSSLLALTNGNYNIAIGQATLSSATGASYNTALGHEAAKVTTGDNNTAIGYKALWANAGGTGNTAIGFGALNVNTTGTNNTAVGAGAGPTTNALSNTTAIGNGATVTANNTIRLGNASVTTIKGQVAITSPSDRRLKKDITPSDLGLDFLMRLRPVSYRLKDGNGRLDYGFIAQEIEQALDGRLTNLITRENNEIKSLKMRGADLFAPTVKAIQEHQKVIEDLQRQIVELTVQISCSKEAPNGR